MIQIPQILPWGEILSSKSNYVLFGIKESGKTLILDKLMIDALQHEGGCNDIPALINFNDLRRSVEDCVNMFWRQDIHKTREILANDNVLLLIDNIDFSDVGKLQVLFDFVSKKKNVRYIGTSLSSWAQNENLNIYNQPLQDFKRVEIEQFKSHQIRELIAKWIGSGYGDMDVQKRVDSIVDAFLHLSIPRTPFAVSMFLRILERQESYKPQNNAVLIKSYIEDLLKDGDKTASREEFDYVNKSTVLAEIAYCMLKEENPNYAIKVSKAQEVIERKLSEFHFKNVYSANKIYADFMKIGIFTLEPDNMIRFRFSCFFEYFLYLRMEKNPTFLEEVLSDENYLKYYNEMVFYTGINRGDSRIIRKVMQDLEYDYIDINHIVFESINGVDEFFNVGSSLLQRIKADDLMKVLPDKETVDTNDVQNDKTLATSEEKNVIENKKKNSNKFNNYSRLLLLAMDVLKNCEELPESIENPTETKDAYYNLVLKNSISYAILYRLIVVEMIKYPDRFSSDRLNDLKFIIRLLPVLHEELLRSHLGTYKLVEIIKNKIEIDASSGHSVPEFERYLSVFLYSDLKGPDHMNILTSFLKSFSRAYIADACFFKMLAYYYASKDKSLDNKLINLLGDLYIKMNCSESKHIQKSAVIASLQSRKSIANRSK